MPEQIRILTVERDCDDGLIVTFSDGTSAAYVTDELIELDRSGNQSKHRRLPNRFIERWGNCWPN